MGIFSKDKDTKPKAKAAKAPAKANEPKAPKASKGAVAVDSRVIQNPRITEKAANVSDQNVYTFDVSPKATKIEIVKAIKASYGFTPVRVNILAIPTKRVWRTTANGVKRGGKKAYVTLKKGDKIEFI